MSSRIVESRPPDAAWTDQERELIAAAREDRMPAALEARLRDALEFPASHPPSEVAERSTFNDGASARQLFVGKLPLWGVLGIAVIGAVSYYALMPARPQPTAAAARVEVAPKGSAPHEAVLGEVSAHSEPGSTAAQRVEAVSMHPDGDAAGAAVAQRAADVSEDPAHRSGPASAQRQGPVRREVAAPRSAQRDGTAHEVGNLPRPTKLRDDAAAPRVLPPAAAGVEARRATSVERRLTPAAQTVSKSGAQVTPDQLRLEAELLQHARSALGHGALSEARQWLARYQGQFARGALQPESQVLGIELNVRTGARTAAKTQADHFISQHPDHPLRDRVQQLTAYR